MVAPHQGFRLFLSFSSIILAHTFQIQGQFMVGPPVGHLEIQPSVHSLGIWNGVKTEGGEEWPTLSSAPFEKPSRKFYTSLLLKAHQTALTELGHVASIIFKETWEMLCFG